MVGFAALCLMWAASAAAQPTPDHLKCYKVQDALNLAGTVDLDTPQFGADPGCTISKAKLFCVPATKTVKQAVDKATKMPITPRDVSGPNPGDRICYKIKCPTTTIPDQQVTDQFGARTVGKFKASMICTPAVKGTGPGQPTCAIGSCLAEGDLCEPCLNGFGGRGFCPGSGFCARTIEGDLRCQAGGSCLQPASNCTSSAQCPGDQFCGPSNGANACCPLCQPVVEVPIICSAQGDQCGKVVGEPENRCCRTGPGIYDEGSCQPSVEGDLRCQALGCLSTTCTSSGDCGSGFFCGRDAGGPGVDLCCPLCQ